jgi:hypothetical protein
MPEKRVRFYSNPAVLIVFAQVAIALAIVAGTAALFRWWL